MIGVSKKQLNQETKKTDDLLPKLSGGANSSQI